ncbi:hypothetical protein HK405_006323 [Cladochytrium tenue]|nr:hypothetical protein HK405_006323 [Cladochytrium tenue]
MSSAAGEGPAATTSSSHSRKRRGTRGGKKRKAGAGDAAPAGVGPDASGDVFILDRTGDPGNSTAFVEPTAYSPPDVERASGLASSAGLFRPRGVLPDHRESEPQNKRRRLAPEVEPPRPPRGAGGRARDGGAYGQTESSAAPRSRYSSGATAGFGRPNGGSTVSEYSPRDASGSTPATGTKPFDSLEGHPDLGEVPRESHTYFTSIEKIVDEPNFESDEGRGLHFESHPALLLEEFALFVHNVYEEIGPHVVQLAGDPVCSKILEKLIKVSSDFYAEVGPAGDFLELEDVTEKVNIPSFEALFLSMCKGKAKAKLMYNLSGKFADLARDKYGSFLLDRCWSLADVPMKEKIATELAAQFETLSSNRTATFALRNYKIDDFRHARAAWVQREMANQRKKDMFKEFTEEEKRKKQKPKAVDKVDELWAADQYKNEMVILGFPPSSSDSTKAQKKLSGKKKRNDEAELAPKKVDDKDMEDLESIFKTTTPKTTSKKSKSVGKKVKDKKA